MSDVADAADGWSRDLAIPEVGMVARVLRLSMLMTNQLESVAAPYGLTSADHLVLGVVRWSPDHRTTPSRLCRLLGRSTGGMSLAIDRLEAAGWLHREPHPDDRRRVMVVLTPQGLAATIAINKSLHEWEDGLALDADQRTAIVQGLDDLLKGVDDTT